MGLVSHLKIHEKFKLLAVHLDQNDADAKPQLSHCLLKKKSIKLEHIHTGTTGLPSQSHNPTPELRGNSGLKICHVVNCSDLQLAHMSQL